MPRSSSAPPAACGATPCPRPDSTKSSALLAAALRLLGRWHEPGSRRSPAGKASIIVAKEFFPALLSTPGYTKVFCATAKHGTCELGPLGRLLIWPSRAVPG